MDCVANCSRRLVVSTVAVLGLFAASSSRTQALEPVTAALQQQVVRIRSDLGGGQSGFGTIVGYKGSQLLIATSSHVVWENNVAASSITARYAEPDPVDGTQMYQGTLLVPVDVARDVAFIAIPSSAARLNGLTFISPHPIKPGDKVYYMGKGNDWFVPPEPGHVRAFSATPQLIEMGGMEFAGGSSGAPVFTSEGVIGMLKERTADAFGAGVSFLAVRTSFDEKMAPQGWTWTARKFPFRIRPAQITVRRRDTLEGISLFLTGGDVDMPLGSNIALNAPEGTYTIRFASLHGGADADYVRCVPKNVVLDSRQPTTIDLRCEHNVTGTWKFSHGGSITFTSDNVNGFTLAILDDQQQQIGEGVARIEDQIYLTINVRDSVRGNWSGRGRITPYMTAGKLTILRDVLGETPFVLSRD